MGLLNVLETLRSDLFHTYYSAAECDSRCFCASESFCLRHKCDWLLAGSCSINSLARLQHAAQYRKLHEVSLLDVA